MSNSNNINAYFDGQMSEAEKSELLKQLDNDASLKQEFEFQTDIIDGLKNARKAELKARLDNVPISSGMLDNSLMGKIAAIGGAILIAGLTYNYFNTNSQDDTVATAVSPKMVQEDVDELLPLSDDNEEIVIEEENKSVIEQQHPKTTSTSTPEDRPNEIKIAKPEINKPVAMEPMDISESNDDEFLPESSISESANVDSSPVEVEINNERKKHSFHYQMKEGRLFLFGEFDKDLYEILEFNAPDGKILYLFYKDKFYNLDRSQSEITELKEITEPGLISKLKDARKS